MLLTSILTLTLTLSSLTHHLLITYSPLTHHLLTTYSPLKALLSLNLLARVGGGWGWVDEMQNKAEAQPAWLQLAAGAGSWA